MHEKKLWFKSKRYGWGWYPVTLQGWAVTLGYILLFLGGELYFMRKVTSSFAVWTASGAFAAYFAVTTALLIWICYRTGEKPRWRWGGKDLAKPNDNY
jgi:hypothetical protein